MATSPLQAFPTPELSDLVGAWPSASLAQMAAVEKQTVMIFSTSSVRDSAITSPTAGMLAYLSTPKHLTQYDGSGWVILSSLDRIGCSLARTTTQELTSGSFQAVTWPTETVDTDGFYTPTGSTVTIPAGMGGLYSITAQVDLASTTPMSIRIAAGGIEYDQPGGTLSDKQSNSVMLPLAAADTIVISAWQQSGGPINIDSARLHVYRIGP